METWVISLPSRPDRLAVFDARMQAAGMDYQVQPGIVPAEMTEFWTGSMGALGCAMAHRAVLERTDGDVLIFEDDAKVDVQLSARLEASLSAIPDPWDVLLVGAGRLVYDTVTEGSWCPPVHRVLSWHQTHAYVVSALGRDHVLAANENAVDNWDHELRRCIGQRKRTWVMSSPLMQDAELGSDIA